MGILCLLVFLFGGFWLIAGLVLGVVGIVFRLGFWALQLAGALVGFLLFGGGVLALLGVLLVINLIGVPLLFLRKR